MSESQQQLTVADGEAEMEDEEEEHESENDNQMEQEEGGREDEEQQQQEHEEDEEEETAPGGEGYQPLLHMKNIFVKYTEQLRLLNDNTLLELAQTGFLEEVKNTVEDGKVTYEHAGTYVEDCMETLRSLSELQITLVKTYREKIQNESQEILTGISDESWRNWDSTKLKKIRDDSSKYEKFSAIARSIGDLQKFADDLAKAFNTLHDEVERMKAEAQKIAEEEEKIRLEAINKAREEAERQKAEAQKKAEEEEMKRREEEARLKAEMERQQKEAEERQRQEEEAIARQEEEERARREAEARRQEEEAKRAAREEEERKRKEEEEERKRREEEERKRLEEMGNPVNWIPYRYEAEGALSSQEIVLRVPKEDFDERYVEFKIAEQSDSFQILGPDEELMSEFTAMTTKEEGIKFEVPAWLAIKQPYFPPGHRENIMKILKNDGEWEELPTRIAKIPSLTDSKYMEAPLEVLESCTIAMISRLKVDMKSISNKESKVESTVDPRVRAIFQKNSVRFNAKVSMSVLPIPNHIIDRIKDKHESAQRLLSSTGHLISIKADRKIRVPVVVNLPLPGGRKGKELPSASRRGSTLSARSDRSQMNTEDEPLFVAWKSQNKWHHTESPEVTNMKDMVSFEIDPNKVDRFMLMKLNQPECSSATIASLAAKTEENTRISPARMITMQRSKEKSRVYLQVCPSEYIERELVILKENGYDSGPMPSAEFELREGQKLVYNFSGNILTDGADHLEFNFNCNLRNSMRELFIKVKDIFDQKCSDEYRGYAELWMQDSEDLKAVVKMPVALPKVYSREENIPHRIPLPRPQDPIITEELFRTLSRELVDDWSELAKALMLKPSLLPSIKLQHADDEEEAVFTLLLTWYSRCGVRDHKVNLLKAALRGIHRPDLARILDQGGQGWSKDNKVWNEVFRELTRGHAGVVKEWASLFRILAESLHMESEVTIHNIRQQGRNMDTECCNLALRKWREMGGSSSSPHTLVVSLKAIDNNLAAEEAEDIFKRNDMLY